MKLDELYSEVKKIISTVDFNNLWEGFRPLKFALYNDRECYFDGKYIPKTDDFLANTAIKYNGEMIAIWNVMDDITPIVMTSKIIHEMFHGFQMLKKETRFPNEFEAIYKYQYIPENLSIKLLENKLILELLQSFNKEKFNTLLSLMKYRYNKYHYEFMYELKIEQIEGSANSVELNALKQISKEQYNLKLEKMKENIVCKTKLFPIRVNSYDIGALRIEILKNNHIKFNEGFNNSIYIEELLTNIEEAKEFEIDDISYLVSDYELKKQQLVKKALEKNDIVMDYETNLLGINFYNAMKYDKYIISQYFVMYGEEENPIVKYGDFVIETAGIGNIKRIYKL